MVTQVPASFQEGDIGRAQLSITCAVSYSASQGGNHALGRGPERYGRLCFCCGHALGKANAKDGHFSPAG